MAIPDHATQIVISGTSESPEEWAFGFWCTKALTGIDRDSNLDALSEWVTFRGSLLSCMATDQAITKYTARLYIGGVLHSQDETAVSHPGTSSGFLPLQCATVLTLRTADLSRSGRGRMYLPTCGASMSRGDSHTWQTTKVSDLVDKFAAFCTSQVALSPVSVVSRTHTVANVVNRIDADFVPDTQRRRRNQLATSRHSAAV